MAQGNQAEKKFPIWEMLTAVATVLGFLATIFFYYDGKQSTENKIVEALSERYESVDREMSYEQALEAVDRDIQALANDNASLQLEKDKLENEVNSLY